MPVLLQRGLSTEHLRPHRLMAAQPRAPMPAKHVAVMAWAIPPRLDHAMTTALTSSDVLCSGASAKVRGTLSEAFLASNRR